MLEWLYYKINDKFCMSMEEGQIDTLADIWAELEQLVMGDDFAAAEDLIKNAKSMGWDVTEMEIYFKLSSLRRRKYETE